MYVFVRSCVGNVRVHCALCCTHIYIYVYSFDVEHFKYITHCAALHNICTLHIYTVDQVLLGMKICILYPVHGYAMTRSSIQFHCCNMVYIYIGRAIWIANSMIAAERQRTIGLACEWLLLHKVWTFQLQWCARAYLTRVIHCIDMVGVTQKGANKKKNVYVGHRLQNFICSIMSVHVWQSRLRWYHNHHTYIDMLCYNFQIFIQPSVRATTANSRVWH